MQDRFYKIVVGAVLAVVAIGAVLVLTPIAPGNAGTVEFKIERGQTLSETARLLADRNLVNSRFVFTVYAVLTGQEKKFKAGTYEIPRSVSIKTLVGIFSQGLAKPDDIIVTIPEGTNLADIDKIFSKAGLTKSGDLLGREMMAHEGYLFPDTYRFSKEPPNNTGTQTVEVIQKLEKNFNYKTETLFKNFSPQKIKEILTIASLLEKEVKTENDMKMVAGIIEKRLSKKMPLEIDATVAYGVCLPKFLAEQYCDVSLANIIDNLRLDSPYNTYKNTGLPAAPISNPGLTAIKAALNPVQSGYLYYLSAKDGTTIFSKTATEHAQARARYLK